jgi:glycosyltransferase involved in cell wall biosynthesis
LGIFSKFPGKNLTGFQNLSGLPTLFEKIPNWLVISTEIFEKNKSLLSPLFLKGGGFLTYMVKSLMTIWQKLFGNKLEKPVKPIIDTPSEAELKRWACGEWIEYQAWLFHYGFVTLHDWQQLRAQALAWQQRPLFSIITPVFNTPPDYLRECIYSVQTQAYPEWEMCLVDDGSENADTKACLQSLVIDDPRLRLHTFSHNQGICHATNQAIAMACGQYVVFLDHDDRLAPDALSHVAETVRNYPNTEIIYSDRDSLSPQKGLRFMHLFKPAWSPETLLSGNYVFHLMVYRRELIEQLEGVRVGLEGSQDYDLILRAAETNPQVRHIPKVLYHWRMHEQSVALAHNVKEYAYLAGIKALQEALERRGLAGEVNENKYLWRGHYQINFPSPPPQSYQTLHLNTLNNYALQINQAFEQNPEIDYLVILGASVQTVDDDALSKLVAWLQISAIGMVTGKVIDEEGNLLHAGLVQRPDGIPLAVYVGFPEKMPGYMAVTAIVRNVSTPHPACCVLKRSLWQRLEGLKTDYVGPLALCDFALRAQMLGTRIVYTPFARFRASEWQNPELWPDNDRQQFVEQWSVWLNQGDPYYNPYLTLELADMGLTGLIVKE